MKGREFIAGDTIKFYDDQSQSYSRGGVSCCDAAFLSQAFWLP
jgi:hypothetical protein